jgi:outer membrane receptor for ferrienterochelin and colicins
LKHRFNVYTSAQHINRESYYGTNQDPDAYGNTTDFTFVAGSQYTRSMDNFLVMPSEFTAGLEFIHNNLDDRMPAYDRHLEQEANSFGGYIQNEWKIPRFSLTLGGRLDKHSLMDNAVFSPRANTRYALTRDITLRASYAHGFRAPQIFDEDLHIAAVGGEVLLITVDPDLEPERSNTFNFSIDLNKNFDNTAFNLLIDAFYTDLKNVFVLEEDEAIHDDHNLHFLRTNAEGATVQGLNFDLNVGLTRKLTANAGFTLQRSRYKEPYEWSEHVEPVKEMLRAPNHYGYLALNYTPIKNFTISATGNFTGSMFVPHFEGFIDEDRLVKTPSFFDAGLKFSYEFQWSKQLKLQLSAGVKNMFDQYQKDLDRGALRDAGFIYGSVMPRVFHFGVRFTM